MKNNVLKYALWILVLGWIAFSIYYVGRDYANKYQTNVVQSSYKKGVEDAVNSLISEAKKCQPVTAYNNEEKIELMWTECGKEGGTSVEGQSPSTEGQSPQS